jgi:hypothetical protein
VVNATTRYPLHRRLGGPQSRSGQVWNLIPAPTSPQRVETFNVNSTWCSQAVTHPCTNHAQCCLTALRGAQYTAQWRGTVPTADSEILSFCHKAWCHTMYNLGIRHRYRSNYVIKPPFLHTVRDILEKESLSQMGARWNQMSPTCWHSGMSFPISSKCEIDFVQRLVSSGGAWLWGSLTSHTAPFSTMATGSWTGHTVRRTGSELINQWTTAAPCSNVTLRK